MKKPTKTLDEKRKAISRMATPPSQNKITELEQRAHHFETKYTEAQKRIRELERENQELRSGIS